MEMFLRNFKWYRKMKGGKWWYVKHYNSLNYIKKLWMHDTDTIDFPEFDGLIMDTIGFFYIRRVLVLHSMVGKICKTHQQRLMVKTNEHTKR